MAGDPRAQEPSKSDPVHCIACSREDRPVWSNLCAWCAIEDEPAPEHGADGLSSGAPRHAVAPASG